MRASRGAIRAVTDDEILAAYRLLAATEGVFCEPASAASVAGLLKYGADGAEVIACVLTGHGLKDPDVALEQVGGGRAVRAAAARDRARRARVATRPPRPVRVPALLGEPRTGLRLLRRGARPVARAGGAEARPASSVVTELDVPRDRSNLAVRAFERLHPADGLRFAMRSEIPLSGGLGSSAAAIVAGLLAARALAASATPTCCAAASEIEGHPDNVAAALLGGVVVCADGERARGSTRPPGLEGAARRAGRAASRRRCARAALPAAVPLADAVANTAHGALLMLGPGARRPRAGRARPARPPARAPPRPSLPALRASCVERRADARRARRDDLRRRPDGAGVGARGTGATRSPRRCASAPAGWARVLPAAFEPRGAAVERASGLTRSRIRWRAPPARRRRGDRLERRVVQPVAADADLVAVRRAGSTRRAAPLTNTPLRLRSSSTRTPSGLRTISAWRRETVGSSKRTSAARPRPIRVHSRVSGTTTISPPSSKQMYSPGSPSSAGGIEQPARQHASSSAG